ncbi:very short patch repair endonuclease [Mesorhizobium atlanticum]|uniref:Very short patch repair endonuclease n=1 Tax=Mesorhizobium atlanticum TaxID=2233532 RepID=A0A330H362_9HYPH|nr:DNA mismatch endonuclease Vsr [Mesorhizobium atlanticum]RAZ80314.1 very short patch repair endonuclease [Mesorhizobium atlanticum]
MGDRLSPEARSAHMRLIRKKNTRPEVRVRKLLHSLGYRFRLHRHDLPGSPDIVLPKHMTAIFVHGCFWHQHAGCRLARKPKSRLDYWLPKLERNAMRDQEIDMRLRELGWHSATIWECETRHEESLRGRLLVLLS